MVLMSDVLALIQARMSSSRLPGKVLSLLKGSPVIDHVIAAAAETVGISNTIVVTSIETSDDPLEAHLLSVGVRVFRGDLDNVFDRFINCLKDNPSNYFFRICGDSPFIDVNLLHEALKRMKEHPSDIVTNVFPRTFPKGQSVELIDAKCFMAIDQEKLDVDEREHVTQTFYRHPESYRIGAIRLITDLSGFPSWCVDTLDDLHRIENATQRPEYAEMIAPL